MPVSADCSVWQSLWTLAKARESGTTPNLKHTLYDFGIGYWGSAFFALCFVIMGTAVMNGPGIEPADQAAPFAAQILNLYKIGLGAWAGPIVGASVISVMLTTTLAGLDALPRVLVAITGVLRGDDSGLHAVMKMDRTSSYRFYVILLTLGSIAVVVFMLESFRAFLDFGTTIAFLAGPVIAILNHRAVFSSDLPVERQPGKVLRTWSLIGITALTLFEVAYLYLLMGGYLD